MAIRDSKQVLLISLLLISGCAERAKIRTAVPTTVVQEDCITSVKKKPGETYCDLTNKVCYHLIITYRVGCEQVEAKPHKEEK